MTTPQDLKKILAADQDYLKLRDKAQLDASKKRETRQQALTQKINQLQVQLQALPSQMVQEVEAEVPAITKRLEETFAKQQAEMAKSIEANRAAAEKFVLHQLADN